MSAQALFLITLFCTGTILAFVATIVYVRRQQAREARQVAELIENRRFYLALIDNNLDTLAVSDPTGHLRFFNQSLVDLLGFSHAELRGMDFRDHIHPDDRAQFDKQWEKLVTGTDPVNFTPFRYYDAHGNYHWKRFLCRNMMRDPDIHGLVLSSSDITDLIEAMDALRLTEQRIRIALAGADIAVYNQDLEGRFTWVFNPLFDFTVDSLLGKTDVDILPPEAAERAVALRKKAIEEGGHVTEEIEYIQDNHRRVISVHLERLLDPNGQVVGVVGSASDVTRLRAIAEQTQLSQRTEAIGKLTGGIAHDFNNLLAIIVGNLELLQEHLEKEPQLCHFANLALKAADRGAGLTRSLLAFARKQSLEISVVDPEKVLAEISELMRRSLPPTIRLVFKAESEGWHCRADPGQLQNAIINLVINARDAMPDGGTVTISTANTHLDHNNDETLPLDVQTGDYVLICVCDTGTGMPPEVLEHVLEPFYTTKPPGKGSGLGLSIVYGFVKQLGGHLTIDSLPGKGTTICMYLPRQLEETEARPVERQAAVPTARGATILVVDDDEDVRQLTCALLKRMDYKILEADSGDAALTRLQSGTPIDLLLTDMFLGPGTSGLDLIDRARKLYPNLPVVLMSGYLNVATTEDADREINAPLLRKPFRRHELETIVNEALAAGQTAHSDPMTRKTIAPHPAPPENQDQENRRAKPAGDQRQAARSVSEKQITRFLRARTRWPDQH